MAISKKNYSLVCLIVIAYSFAATFLTYASARHDLKTTTRMLLFVLGGALLIAGFIGLYRLKDEK